MMKNQINIDFQIYDSGDPKTFIIIDTSNWEHLKDKAAIIEVILPGETQPSVTYLTKNNVNILNAINLNIVCDDCDGNGYETELPDGIYDITIKGSPDKFQKNRKYLRTTKTELELDKLFIKLNFGCFNTDNDIREKINKLNEIRLVLSSAKANARYGNNDTAQNLLFKVQDLINKNKKCRDCI